MELDAARRGRRDAAAAAQGGRRARAAAVRWRRQSRRGGARRPARRSASPTSPAPGRRSCSRPAWPRRSMPGRCSTGISSCARRWTASPRSRWRWSGSGHWSRRACCRAAATSSPSTSWPPSGARRGRRHLPALLRRRRRARRLRRRPPGHRRHARAAAGGRPLRGDRRRGAQVRGDPGRRARQLDQRADHRSRHRRAAPRRPCLAFGLDSPAERCTFLSATNNSSVNGYSDVDSRHRRGRGMGRPQNPYRRAGLAAMATDVRRQRRDDGGPGRPRSHRRGSLGDRHPRDALRRGARRRPHGPGPAGPRPVHPQQGPLRRRALRHARALRLLPARGAGHVHGAAVGAQRPSQSHEGAGRGDQYRPARPRLPRRRRLRAGRPPARAGLPHVRRAGRRRAAGGHPTGRPR